MGHIYQHPPGWSGAALTMPRRLPGHSAGLLRGDAAVGVLVKSGHEK
jgi:hypothetical protein